MSKVHIGKKIKEVLNKSSFTVVEFARQINLTRDGVYKIMEKETIDTAQLQKISKVLDHDFFNYYSQGPQNLARETKPEYGYATKDELAQVTSVLQNLVKEIEKLREELPKKRPARKTKK